MRTLEELKTLLSWSLKAVAAEPSYVTRTYQEGMRDAMHFALGGEFPLSDHEMHEFDDVIPANLSESEAIIKRLKEVTTAYVSTLGAESFRKTIAEITE